MYIYIYTYIHIYLFIFLSIYIYLCCTNSKHTSNVVSPINKPSPIPSEMGVFERQVPAHPPQSWAERQGGARIWGSRNSSPTIDSDCGCLRNSRLSTNLGWLKASLSLYIYGMFSIVFNWWNTDFAGPSTGWNIPRLEIKEMPSYAIKKCCSNVGISKHLKTWTTVANAESKPDLEGGVKITCAAILLGNDHQSIGP